MVRIALVFRGFEGFSWILVDLKCNSRQNIITFKNNSIEIRSFLAKLTECNASFFSFCGLSKVGRPLDEFLSYHTRSNDVIVVSGDLMTANMDP